MGRLKELEEKFLSAALQSDTPFEQPDEDDSVTNQLNQTESKTQAELERYNCSIRLLLTLVFLMLIPWHGCRLFWENKANRAIDAFAQPREQESNLVKTWLDRLSWIQQ